MLRTGEDWDSQQHGNARSVIEINIYEIFRSPIEPTGPSKELEAYIKLTLCKLIILSNVVSRQRRTYFIRQGFILNLFL